MIVTLHLLTLVTPFLILYPLPPLLPPARTDNPNADSVVVGITFACVLLLALITLMVTSCYFILKNTTVTKNVSVMSPWSWLCYMDQRCENLSDINIFVVGTSILLFIMMIFFINLLCIMYPYVLLKISKNNNYY